MSDWSAEIKHCQFIHPTADKCKSSADYRVYDGALNEGKYACRRHLEEMMNPMKNRHIVYTVRSTK